MCIAGTVEVYALHMLDGEKFVWNDVSKGNYAGSHKAEGIVMLPHID